ncbi:DUF4870 domain-containing protein [Gleimia hominis]|uniref:DUF4870 domain-containing protein n=1 Tax=Gleimia hominis TaxID=595468 RepID=UPI000C80675C|nr:DUF4870 domain-containing protein [Gleimia hominis]WIK65171.1 DUF4870 domain-containing protein [Gleimia hominis]
MSNNNVRYNVPNAPSGNALAVIAHLSALIAMVFSVGWLGFVGPLVIWALARGKDPFAQRAAAGAFNFALGITIMTLIGWALLFTFILIPVTVVLWGIAFIATLWCSIRGAVLANRGELYQYPFQIRILS